MSNMDFFIFDNDLTQIYKASWMCMSDMDFYVLHYKGVWVFIFLSTLYTVLVIANRMHPVGEKHM
jgi:hypothetical protein